MKDTIINPPESYVRNNLDHIGTATEQYAFYVSKMKGISISEATDRVTKVLQHPDHIAVPTVDHYLWDEREERTIDTCSLTNYMDRVKGESLRLAPTFTTYLSDEVKKSYLSEMMDEGSIERDALKTKKFEAAVSGDKQAETYYQIAQVGVKLDMNSVSGLLTVQGTIITRKSGHAVLTTTTRLATSITNASIENMLAGNRQYTTPDIALNHLIALANYASKGEAKDRINQCISLYGIHVPSTDDIMVMVDRCTKPYFLHPGYGKKIVAFLNTLGPTERCMVLYGSDLYDLRLHNDTLLRKIIKGISTIATGVYTETTRSELETIPEDILNAVHHTLSDTIKGQGVRYSAMSDALVAAVLATAKQMISVIDKYWLLLNTFLCSPILPTAISDIKSMVRQPVVGSDTDSSLYTVQEWVQWYSGNLILCPENLGVASSVSLLQVMVISHSLRQISTNLGAPPKMVDGIRMKNEITFNYMATMGISKTYYTDASVVEGNVLAKPYLNVKGAQLMGSEFPKPIVDLADRLMNKVGDDLKETGKINLKDYIQEVIAIEKQMSDSIRKGESVYLGRTVVKPVSAYKSDIPLETPYRYILFWNETFGAKYNHIVEAPISMLKIPVALNNKTEIKDWVNSIPDEATRTRLAATIGTRAQVPILYLPQEYIVDHGMFDDVLHIVAIKRQILKHTKPLRHILQSFGYGIPSELTVTEYYTP